MAKEGVVSEKTLVPIGFVLVLLGGAAWLTNMHYEAQANSLAIADLAKKQDAYLEGQKDIVERLARIEGKLEGVRKWSLRRGE